MPQSNAVTTVIAQVNRHSCVESNLVEARQRRRRECDECSRQPDGEPRPTTLPIARSVDSASNWRISRPRPAPERYAPRSHAPPHGARQHQAGEVGARDHENEADRPEATHSSVRDRPITSPASDAAEPPSAQPGP